MSKSIIELENQPKNLNTKMIKKVKSENRSFEIGEARFLVDSQLTVEIPEEVKEFEKEPGALEGNLEDEDKAKFSLLRKTIKRRRIVTHTKEIRKARTRSRNFPRLVIIDRIYDEETGRVYTTENFVTILSTSFPEFLLNDTESTIFSQRLVNQEIFKVQKDISMDDSEIRPNIRTNTNKPVAINDQNGKDDKMEMKILNPTEQNLA